MLWRSFIFMAGMPFPSTAASSSPFLVGLDVGAAVSADDTMSTKPELRRRLIMSLFSRQPCQQGGKRGIGEKTHHCPPYNGLVVRSLF
jgi:hypothetical protein